MSNRKPIIGVTGPDRGGEAAWWFTRLAVWMQGGKAVRISPGRTPDEPKIDGLILGGGADINPEHYGEPLPDFAVGGGPKPSGLRQWFLRILSLLFFPLLFLLRKLFSTKSPRLDRERDRIEFKILHKAVEQQIPVLGICRGAQMINIYFGGNLHQEIATFYTEIPRINTIWPKKRVNLKEGSRLRAILESATVWVNALHHQAVDRVGESLEIVAREETGIAQAIEQNGHSFMIGVQWHPEYMPQKRRQRAIFRQLVELAARKSAE